MCALTLNVHTAPYYYTLIADGVREESRHRMPTDEAAHAVGGTQHAQNYRETALK